MLNPDCVHDPLARSGSRKGILGQKSKKIALQHGFIGPVLLQPGREAVVMGGGEGIGGIMNQLSDGIDEDGSGFQDVGTDGTYSRARFCNYGRGAIGISGNLSDM